MSAIFSADGTIYPARFVRASTTANNSVAQCVAGERPIGISQYGSRITPLPVVAVNEAAEDGEELQVFNANSSRQDIMLEAGTGGWTRGQLLRPDVNGKGITGGSGPVGAIALESVSAGEKGQVLLVLDPISLDPIVYEFDCETGIDSATHILLPAAANAGGLVIVDGFAIVTEVFGGATEDQGIVTVTDTDANSLFTLTPSNLGADAINDVIVGTSLPGAVTGDAAKVVAAGKGIEASVTQATSGSGAAGKMKVVLIVRPL